MSTVQIGTWVKREFGEGGGPRPPDGFERWPVEISVDDAVRLAGAYVDQQGLMYDRKAVEQDDSLSADDILTAALLNARIDGGDVVTLMEADVRRRINTALDLQVVPNDLSLYEVDGDVTESALGRYLTAVFQEFLAISGVNIAKTTKVLHKKRPRLIPIVDDRLAWEPWRYGRMSGLDRETAEERGLALVRVTGRICLDVQASSDALNAVRARVPGMDGLTTIRIFDIIAWQYAAETRGIWDGSDGSRGTATPPVPQPPPPPNSGDSSSGVGQCPGDELNFFKES